MNLCLATATHSLNGLQITYIWITLYDRSLIIILKNPLEVVSRYRDQQLQVVQITYIWITLYVNVENLMILSLLIFIFWLTNTKF